MHTCTAKIWLEGVGVAPNPKHGKLLHNELERSGVDNIYAIGDVLVTTSCVYVCTTVREDNWKQLLQIIKFSLDRCSPRWSTAAAACRRKRPSRSLVRRVSRLELSTKFRGS